MYLGISSYVAEVYGALTQAVGFFQFWLSLAVRSLPVHAEMLQC